MTAWLTRAAAAEYCSCSTSTIQRWVADGRLIEHRATPTAHPRYRLADLDAAITGKRPRGRAA